MGSLVCKCNEEGKDKEVDFIQEKNQFGMLNKFLTHLVDLLTENISLKRELNQIQNKYVVYTILIYQLNDLGAGENTPNQVGEHLKKLDSSNNIEPLNSNFSNNSFIRKVQSYSKSKSSLNVIPSKRKSEFQNKRELEDLNSRIKLDGIERVTSPNSSFEIITGNIMKVNLQSNNTSLALNLKSNKDSKINACLLKNNNNQLNLDTEIIYSLDSGKITKTFT